METSAGLTWVSGSSTPPKVLITRVINLGMWEEWNAMRREFSREQILDAVEHPLRGQWNPRGKAFAECVFDRTLPDDVLISYA